MVVVKTTARFLEAHEPIKQKPIIQIQHPSPANSLPDTIRGARASVDGGRDNPFRPDGPIYRSADPIVDFYKQPSNQSRSHSPTDSQLLYSLIRGESELEGKQLDGKQSKTNKKSKSKKSKDKSNQITKTKSSTTSCAACDCRTQKLRRGSANQQVSRGDSCWRRWLCCCCCCRGRSGKPSGQPTSAHSCAAHSNVPEHKPQPGDVVKQINTEAMQQPHTDRQPHEESVPKSRCVIA